jgi:hypothetical protein
MDDPRLSIRDTLKDRFPLPKGFNRRVINGSKTGVQREYAYKRYGDEYTKSMAVSQ